MSKLRIVHRYRIGERTADDVAYMHVEYHATLPDDAEAVLDYVRDALDVNGKYNTSNIYVGHVPPDEEFSSARILGLTLCGVTWKQSQFIRSIRDRAETDAEMEAL